VLTFLNIYLDRCGQGNVVDNWGLCDAVSANMFVFLVYVNEYKGKHNRLT